MDAVTEEFHETYNEFIFRKADAYRIPIMGTFELTPGCNMDCRMCYIRQSGKQIRKNGGLKSLEFWEGVFDQAIENGMLFCLLTGGEILTYPYFRQLYEKICRKGIHIVLNTNGTLWDEETVRWIAKIPPRRLNISLYGASEDTYEKLCCFSDGFHKVIRCFELLTEYHIPFRVHGVLVPENIHDYEKMKDICNHFRVPLELTYYMFPPLRKETDIKVQNRFTPKQMAEVAFRYRKDQCGGDGERWTEFLKSKQEALEHPENRKYYGVNRITCRSGCSAFWVNWKGEISGCQIEDTQNHDLEKMKFSDAWDKITKYTEEVPLSEECAVCRYRDLCPVCASAAYCETGRIDGTPRYLCEFCEHYADLLRIERERLG